MSGGSNTPLFQWAQNLAGTVSEMMLCQNRWTWYSPRRFYL